MDGPRFTTPKVAATPMRAAAVIGNGRTLEFTAMPNTVVTNDSREKKYQWERKEGTSWVSVPDATSETLSIVANDATAAGTSRYRCKVSVGDAYNVYSSEVACTLAPAAPAGWRHRASRLTGLSFPGRGKRAACRRPTSSRFFIAKAVRGS